MDCMNVADLVAAARAAGASDVHLVCGLPVKFRVAGQLVDAAFGSEGASCAPLTHDDCEALCAQILHAQTPLVRMSRDLRDNLAGGACPAAADTDGLPWPVSPANHGTNWRREEGPSWDTQPAQVLSQCGEVDLALEVAGVRVRVNLFRQQGHATAAIRLLSDVIPSLESLGLPPAVYEFAQLKRGIVIVTGETGSGKSTTLAALIDTINRQRAENIITLEDPIEYVHTPRRSVISQREIGRDTVSYASGLRAVLREDPDVILIGEMRDLETIQAALTAAETGHLVLATLHTKSAAESIDRIVDVFPAGLQRQIRMQLSTSLVAVLSQQLVPAPSAQGVAKGLHQDAQQQSPLGSQSHDLRDSLAGGACSEVEGGEQDRLPWPVSPANHGTNWRREEGSSWDTQPQPQPRPGRVLAAELMMVTPAIRNLIREGKTPQIASALATSAAAGSVSMDNSLLNLARSGAISVQSAVECAHDADYVRGRLH